MPQAAPALHPAMCLGIGGSIPTSQAMSLPHRLLEEKASLLVMSPNVSNCQQETKEGDRHLFQPWLQEL